MRKLIVLLFLFTQISQSHSFGATTISGLAPYFRQHTIKAFIYNDYVSHSYRELAKSPIDSAGNFVLKFNLEESTFLFLKIGQCKIELYAEPDSGYTLSIGLPDTLQLKLINHDAQVDYKLISAHRNGLNSLIAQVNNDIDEFFTTHYELFLVKAARTKTDSFRVALNKKYEPYFTNYFFKNYFRYALASLDLGAYHSSSFLYSNYLSGPVLYTNNQYFDFINDYYKSYLSLFADSKKGEELLIAVNTNSNYTKAYEVFKTDVQIKNDTLRELVFIKGLYEFYFRQDCAKDKVLKCLQYATKNAMVAQNRSIAENIYTKLSAFFIGSPAPDFELKNAAGKLVKLSSYKGKAVIVTFGASWSEDFINETKVLNRYQKEFGKKVVVLNVIAEDDLSQLKQIWKVNKYNSELLSYVNHPEVLEQYGVKSLPEFFLIDKNGDFLEAPSEMPSRINPAKYTALTKLK